MTVLAATLDAPLPPAAFRGRERAVQTICERLLNAERLSTSLVGGPRTGKTSLLRYLASSYADAHLPGLPHRSYVDAQLLSSTSKPADFWTQVFRGLRAAVQTRSSMAGALDERIGGRQNRAINAYDLEDVFDAFANAGEPAVVLVDGWELILKSQGYWGDFFHIVRSMGQRQPRGVAFVVGTPRRLLDLWADQMGSVYYNIFVTVTIGRMDEAEIRRHVQESLEAAGLPASQEAEQAVLAASDGHPYLVALVTHLVTSQLTDKGRIDAAEIGASLRDPQGRVVELVHQIRAALGPTERLWLDTLRTAPAQVTAAQRAALERLRDYGLLPPGTKI